MIAPPLAAAELLVKVLPASQVFAPSRLKAPCISSEHNMLAPSCDKIDHAGSNDRQSLSSSMVKEAPDSALAAQRLRNNKKE